MSLPEDLAEERRRRRRAGDPRLTAAHRELLGRLTDRDLREQFQADLYAVSESDSLLSGRRSPVQSPTMTGPQYNLPEEIALSLSEAARVLFALDVGFEALPEGAERAQVAAARLLITRKLWPELGDLLGPDEGQG